MVFSHARIQKVGLAFTLCTLLLLVRLVYLQGFMGQQLAALGLLSRVHELKLKTLRGPILDRNLKPLTGWNQEYSVLIFPRQFKDQTQISQRLAELLPQHAAVITARIAQAVRPEKILQGITEAEAKAVHDLQLSGVVVDQDMQRYGERASHVIGYANQADNHGNSGIEGAADGWLKIGAEQYLAALLDARAELIPGLRYKKLSLPAPAESASVVLTIDSVIQQTAEAVFDRYACKGAMVVLNPYTGDVLAMLSRPNFNAAHLSSYLNREDAPLLNRAVAAYQPGSVFKLAVAAAALEQRLVTPEEPFLDQGSIEIDGTIFRGWDYQRGARRINFTEAMAYSSNPVFIEVGLRVGMKELVSFAESLGFAQKTGLELAEEQPGHLPARTNIYRGETANLSLGQGECEATPLQIARLVAAIVNDGIQIQPALVDRVLDVRGEILDKRAPAKERRVFSRQTARIIRDMMTAVNVYGTGQAAFMETGGSAGKTGSAETGRQSGDGKGINHAWYAGFAPLQQPQYAVVVFVEDGMSGGDVAAPIFREFLLQLQNQVGTKK